MVTIDCTELTTDEKLALASAISDGMEGTAFALIKGESIMIDSLSGEKLDPEMVRGIVTSFISRRKNAEGYSTEMEAERIVVHSADPAAAVRRKQQQKRLPPNLKQCPFCSFITPYAEVYVVHVRSHGVGV